MGIKDTKLWNFLRKKKYARIKRQHYLSAQKMDKTDYEQYLQSRYIEFMNRKEYTKGKTLSFDNPQTFTEKSQWIKLYDQDPRKPQLADKYRVRDFIKKTIGEEYLIPIISIDGVDHFENANDIDFEKLPNKFVLKCNHGSHMNIIVEVKSDGSVWGYDCGDASNWARSNNGAPIQISTSFVQNDSRPGKIIRVSNVSGSDCKTAESGEWMTWRQYAPAPWANIRLGNSSATIGGYGCFVTSIAIQIARSGAPTNLSEFNPGTFVQELNKYGSFDGNGNFQGTHNIPKIVPSFQTAATAINIYGMSKSEKISTIQKYIDQGYYVLLRVKYNTGQHWVAVTGTTADGIQMVDPGSDATMVWDKYPVSESSTINLYKIG